MNLCVRGGKRGGAREHCSQKEMDRAIIGRRILVKSPALVMIFSKKAIYHTAAVGPMMNRFFSFANKWKQIYCKVKLSHTVIASLFTKRPKGRQSKTFSNFRGYRIFGGLRFVYIIEYMNPIIRGHALAEGY